MFGQIFDIYIARKKDKMGNRFGFISMLDVKDRTDLLTNLRNIRIGENKLWFNVARFVLEDGEINVPAEERQPMKTGQPSGMKQTGTKFDKGERSFRDMLAGKSIKIDDNVNGFSMLHGKAVVGRMKDVEALKSIFVFLNKICPGYGKVQYLGGLDLLISFEDPDMASVVLEAANKDNDKFMAACIWNGQSLSCERLAWVKVQGIPLHLFTQEVINMVGGSFGKVVHKAVKLDSDSDLSYEYVGIIVGDGKRLSEEIVLEWKNRKFRVWINEEMGDWIPEFYPVKESTAIPTRAADPVDMNTAPVVDEVRNVVVNDVEMPEFAPEVVADETDKNMERNVNLESNECCNDEANNCQYTPLNVQGLNKEDVSNFVPAAMFDFDKPINEDPIEDIQSKISKRKKGKKTDLGRPSNVYVSSNESLRTGKKPRNKSNDIFGLNSLLGINDSPSIHSEDSETKEDEYFDLNSNPVDPVAGDNSYEQQIETEEDVVNRLQNHEVAATKALGSQLGVNLEVQDKLIMDSIVTEGLQTGIK